MLIKVITLRFSEKLDGFDDEPLQAFMADKRIFSFNEQFFVKEGVPYWAVMLAYAPGGAGGDAPQPKTASKKDYRILLTEATTPVFNRLRDWRNERARKDGVPRYILFTNYQLAEIAAKSPDSLSALAAVEGVGKSRIEKYGRDVLGIVQAGRSPASPAVKLETPVPPVPAKQTGRSQLPFPDDAPTET